MNTLISDSPRKLFSYTSPAENALFHSKTASIAVVISCLNEAATLRKVSEACLSYCNELIIVDGHSTDGSQEIVSDLPARVILDNKKGKGDAIRCALGAVTSDIVVFVDADGSHDPHDIPRLVAPLLRNEADLVIGSRGLGGSDELHGDCSKFLRMTGSALITLGINYRFNVKLTDSQNGFRAITSSAAKSLELQEDITTIEQEMVIRALQKTLRIVEVPTHEYARVSGNSRIVLYRVAWRYLYSWIKLLLMK